MMAKKKIAEKKSTDLFNSITSRAAEETDDLFAFDSFFDEEEKDAIKQGFEEAWASGTEMVDIDLLDANELSRYHMRDEDSFEALKDLIRTNGFEQSFAIVGKKKPDGRVTILSGHRRTAVAKSLTDEDGNRIITHLPITYKEFDREVKELEFVAAANLKRADNISDILNMYRLFSEYYDRGDWTEEEIAGNGKIDFIAGKMGVPESRIRNNMFLLKYDPVIAELIDEGVFSVNDMRKLHSENEKGKLKNHDQIVAALCENEVLKRAGEGGDALAEARKEAKAIFAGAERKYDRKKKEKAESAGKVAQRILRELKKPGRITAEGMSAKEKEAARKDLAKAKKEIEKIEAMLKER